MSDLVERLRERPSRYASETEEQAKERRQQEREEAAARIEQLEAALREVMEQCPEHVPYGLKNQIRATLGEERT